ncbi:MAG: BMP family ABC transporter substrate-binding protein [Bdellovibrionales bacterium]|nr:BMP family ABC transporter substrate-binding protein [Bdellovibrionales bacterium]
MKSDRMTFKLLLTFALAAMTLIGCKKDGDSAAGAGSQKAGGFKVGLILDKGGRDDKSFNSAAFRGATQAVKDLGIELKEIESPDDNSFEPALKSLADRGFPLIVAVGFSQKDAVQKVAPLYPKTQFALVDAVVEGPNTASLMFAEHEGSFLVGYLAGLTSKTGVVGFVGGMEVPMIKRFQLGYESGVKEAAKETKKTIKTLVSYAGNTSDAWVNPARGKELAISQFNQKADIIFHAAGATGMGVFDAAEEKKFFAIGCDSNQNWVKPGRVLTSMLKRVDTAVFEVIKEATQGQFKAGLRSFSLKDQGVDYAADDFNASLVAPHKEQLEAMKQKIIAGQISVPDYYENQKK